jgi:hypothetical protein
MPMCPPCTRVCPAMAVSCHRVPSACPRPCLRLRGCGESQGARRAPFRAPTRPYSLCSSMVATAMAAHGSSAVIAVPPPSHHPKPSQARHHSHHPLATLAHYFPSSLGRRSTPSPCRHCRAEQSSMAGHHQASYRQIEPPHDLPHLTLHHPRSSLEVALHRSPATACRCHPYRRRSRPECRRRSPGELPPPMGARRAGLA